MPPALYAFIKLGVVTSKPAGAAVAPVGLPSGPVVAPAPGLPAPASSSAWSAPSTPACAFGLDPPPNSPPAISPP